MPQNDFRHQILGHRVLGEATTIPTGAGAIGDMYLITVPLASGNIGWVCTTAGAAGVAVWKTWGAIAA